MHSYVFILLSFWCASTFAVLPAEVHYEWKYINYTWRLPEAYNQAVRRGSYIKEHISISGIKVWKDKIYLTSPRYYEGVPATLMSVPLDDEYTDSPLLTPFPNWRMQNPNECSAFQFVQSMEIDPRGRMWVLDNGRVDTRTDKPKYTCPPKLVILDLENYGEVVYRFVFPDDVTRPHTGFLNDIVLDYEDGGFAYITDTDKNDPGLIVFSLRDRSSWKIRHWTMFPAEEARYVTVNGTTYDAGTPIDGIALSPASAEQRFVYYCPVSSFKLYAMPTWVLKVGIKDVDPYVTEVGQKSSQAGGMVISASGDLYFGLLRDDAVVKLNIENPPYVRNQGIVIQDHAQSQHPDTFAIDSSRKLWYVSNRLQVVLANSLNTEETNFRIIVAQIDAKNYQYLKDGSVPKLPIVARPTAVDQFRKTVVDWFIGV